MGNELLYLAIGIVIAIGIIGSVLFINWVNEGREIAESGNVSGLGNWLIPAIIVLLIVAGIGALVMKAKGG